jgi:nucleotide-binding universal stress UspA family protein
MFRSVLAAVKPSRTQAHLVDYAVMLATGLRLELHGCVVFDAERLAPLEPVPPGGGAFKKERDKQSLDAARAAADDVMAKFAAAGSAAGACCTAEVVEGDVVEVLARRAQEHDLLLVGQAPGDRGDVKLLSQVLRASPRPAIVFPKRPISGLAVVVGYDGSPSSARALAALAASGLASGRQTHVVSCAASADEAESIGGIACRHLRRHGVEATAHAESLERTPAETLLNWTSRVGAALLVVGDGARSRLHEALFGSTTRALLEELPVPLLLDH